MTHTYTLTNGIRVVTEYMEGYRSASFGLFVGVGSADENETNNGMAHVIEHMLFKGTTSKSAKTIADETTAIGGNLDAFTTKEYTCFYAQTLDIYLNKAIDIISDMVLNSLLDENELAKELGVILEEIDMYEDDPEELVHELLQERVWKNQSIGYMISGKKEVVKNFTREQIVAFINHHYVGHNMVISVAGHFNEQQLIQYIEKAFNQIKAGTTKQPSSKPTYTKDIVLYPKQLEQMHLDIAYPCIPYHSKERFAFTLFNNILGGNPNARLFQEIREKRGMSYAIYSYGSAFKTCGLFQIYAAINPAQGICVLEAIKDVIKDTLTRSISNEDLALSKAQLEIELTIEAESSQNRMEGNGKSLLYGEKIDTLDEILQETSAVTSWQIQDFVHKYLEDVSPSLCIVGDVSNTNTENIKALINEFGKMEA